MTTRWCEDLEYIRQEIDEALSQALGQRRQPEVCQQHSQRKRGDAVERQNYSGEQCDPGS